MVGAQNVHLSAVKWKAQQVIVSFSSNENEIYTIPIKLKNTCKFVKKNNFSQPEIIGYPSRHKSFV